MSHHHSDPTSPSKLAEAWSGLMGALPFESDMESDVMNLRLHAKIIAENGLETQFTEAFFSNVEEYVESKVATSFFQALAPVKDLPSKNLDEDEILEELYKILTVCLADAERKVARLKECIWQLAAILSNPSGQDPVGRRHSTDKALHRRLEDVIHCAFFADPPDYFYAMWRAFFSRTIASFDEDATRRDLFLWRNDMSYYSDRRKFENVCRLIQGLGWTGHLEALCAEVAFTVITTYLELHSHITRNEEDQELVWGGLDRFRKWVQQVVVQWLSAFLLTPGATGTMESGAMHSLQTGRSRLNVWKGRIDFFVYDRMGDLRLDELFVAIKYWPDSKSALEDLRECLLVTQRFDKLERVIVQDLSKRLLNPGPHTEKIIQLFIKTIHVFRLLDPTDSILPAILEPMSAYTSGRDDAVRAMVKITKENMISKEEVRVGRQGQHESDTEDETEGWAPKPVQHNQGNEYVKNKDDIISVLINLFGNATMFAEEYRKMLGGQIVNRQTDFFENIREMEDLELMKLRLGKDKLHYCEIMIHDLYGSHQINNNIREKLLPHFSNVADFPKHIMTPTNFSATIVSKEFWPNLDTYGFTLPPAIATIADAFEQYYKVFKYRRFLNWCHALGTVVLELELCWETVEIQVHTAHASVLLHAIDIAEELKNPPAGHASPPSRWFNESALFNRCAMPKNFFRRILLFWLKRAVLKDRNGKLRVADGHKEETEVLTVRDSLGPGAVEWGEDDTADFQFTEEENHLETIKYQILGLLSKFTKRGLPSVINTLKVMNPNMPPSLFVSETIEKIFNQLIQDGEVVCTEGLFQRR